MEFGDVYFNGEGKTGDPEKKPRSKARTTANSSHEARGRNHNQTNKPINWQNSFFLFGSEGDSEQAKHFVGISPSHCKVYGETEKFFLKLPSDKNVTVHNYLPS